MKACPKCDWQNEDTAAFCIKCGERLVEATKTVTDSEKPDNDFMNKAGDLLNTGASRAKEAAANLQKNVSASKTIAAEVRKGFSFVDQSETAVATIGNNYLQNYLLGNNLSKGIGILTQKRFYYMGKSFYGGGKNIESSTKEGVVEIEDICYTEFAHVRHTGFLLAAILLTLLGLALLAQPISKVLLIAALPLFITYFIKRSSRFVVYFPGGWFAFNICWYPISDIQDFQRQLHLLKDHIKEEQRA